MGGKSRATGGRQGGMPGWKALRNGPAARTGPTSAADPLLPTLRRALEAHRRREFRQAALLYQQILAVNANHPEAIQGLGMALFQLGQPESAEPRLRRAIELAPKSSVFHGNLGAVLLALDRPAEALESYRKAVRLEPEIAPLHAGLAAALLTLGRAEEAAQSARRALRLKPDLPLGHAQLGRALAAANRTAEGLASLDRALALDPAFVEAHIWRADVLHRLGDAEAALAGYRAAARLAPGYAAAHLGIAQTLLALGRFEGAADNFRAAIYTRPSATAYAGLARALRALGEAEAAVEPFDMAHRLAPADAAVAEERAALYAELGRDLQADAPAPAKLTRLEEEEARARMAVKVTPGNHVALGNLGNTLVGLGRLHEAREVYRQALAAKPDYFWVWSELIFLMNYLGDVPVEEMVAEARRYGQMVSSRHPPRLVHDNDRDPDRRLRVGFVSADLYGHPVARFLEGVLGELDREALEPVVYDTGKVHDALTERLQQVVPRWHAARDWSDDELERAILADRIDILVDLSGHTSGNRLPVFARKPAPVAFTWLGYFATTGVAAIDYVLSTPWVIPPGDEWQWTETPWHMPETYLCFTPPRLAVPLVSPPLQRNGFVTFGSANNLNKLSDPTLETWADVLLAVPASRLVLRSEALSDAKVAAETRARFAARGIAAERLVLLGAVSDYGDHLARYNEIDIALDPFPYAGGTTTIEALWMGVPVLTLAGDRYVSRMGENIVQNMGLPDWIATDRADYVARAARFAADGAALSRLRQDLRHRLLTSPLADAPRFARHFEAALRGMWHRWCAGGSN